MGAGCWYTHKSNPELRVVWVDASCECDDYFDDPCDCSTFIHEYVESVLTQMFGQPWELEGVKYWYVNNFYKINLESTYHGDGILLYYEIYSDDGDKGYPLARYHHEASYHRFLKNFLKAAEGGLSLRIASSAWTSTSWSE